jgi:pyrroline-5-carboxylate reductase
MTQDIAFIGAGNMANALIGGLIADGIDPDRIIASDPSPDARAALADVHGIATTGDNATAAAAATVVLAVKPQVLREVAVALGPTLQRHRPLVISIAAGVRCDSLFDWLGGPLPLVRSMPNTPAMLQAGATVLYATDRVSPAQRDAAESLLRAVGLTCWVDDESAMDAVTALSGSGPAYLFLVMESMQQAAVDCGLDHETARLLTLQTALGAARMALESDETPDRLRARVTSPGGTTERAVEVLESGGLRDLFARAIRAAHDRSVELSVNLGAR